MAGTFTKTLTDSFTGDQTLAPELEQTLNWMEDQGWLQTGAVGPFMPLYPSALMGDPALSLTIFAGSDLRFTQHWSTPDPTLDKRLAEIAITAGDGGRAAIWTDDAGDQWFVHLSHDSLGVISRDPVVFLQFLALGYSEPGALDQTSVTPLQNAMDANGVTELNSFALSDLLILPSDLQTYLTSAFGVTFPETAADLGIADFTSYGDETTTDPFVQWVNAVTPPPTAEELAYIKALGERAERMTFEDLNLDETEEPKGVLDTLKGFIRPNK